MSALTANMAGGGGGADDNTAQGGHLIASAITAREGKGPDSDAPTTLVGFDAARITSGENRSNPRPGDPQPPLAATRAPHVALVGPLQTGHTPNGHGMAGVNDQYAASGHLVPVAFGHKNAVGPSASEGVANSVRDGGGQGGGSVMQPAPTLTAGMGTNHGAPGSSGMDELATATALAGAAVRRLTPLECERLMGLPDNWTATSDGRPQADSARYRQLGNSIAVPVFTWVALGIAEYEAGR